jgi:hypothetical protein
VTPVGGAPLVKTRFDLGPPSWSWLCPACRRYAVCGGDRHNVRSAALDHHERWCEVLHPPPIYWRAPPMRDAVDVGPWEAT